MLLSLASLITSQFLLTLHLNQYASDGEGYMVLDILSKITAANSEVVMSMLLIMIA
jgi:Rhodopsin-like GPCR transmembrane domain